MIEVIAVVVVWSALTTVGSVAGSELSDEMRGSTPIVIGITAPISAPILLVAAWYEQKRNEPTPRERRLEELETEIEIEKKRKRLEEEFDELLEE